MPLVLPVTARGVTPETSRPDPDRVISGDPVHTTWNIEDAEGLYCGLWQSTPGAWRVSYSEWEYCRILEGDVRLTGDDGSTVEAGPGGNLVIEPGFEGVWENLTPVRKLYVIDLGEGGSE